MWRDLVPLWQAYKDGFLPEAGGWLDQPHWYTVLVGIFEAAVRKEERELWEFERKRHEARGALAV